MPKDIIFKLSSQSESCIRRFATSDNFNDGHSLEVKCSSMAVHKSLSSVGDFNKYLLSLAILTFTEYLELNDIIDQYCVSASIRKVTEDSYSRYFRPDVPFKVSMTKNHSFNDAPGHKEYIFIFDNGIYGNCYVCINFYKNGILDSTTSYSLLFSSDENDVMVYGSKSIGDTHAKIILGGSYGKIVSMAAHVKSGYAQSVAASGNLKVEYL